MEQAQRISGIKARALKVGLSLGRLCALAKVPTSTPSRWQREDANPTLKLFSETIGKLEAALEARERAVLAELAARYPDEIGRRAA